MLPAAVSAVALHPCTQRETTNYELRTTNYKRQREERGQMVAPIPTLAPSQPPTHTAVRYTLSQSQPTSCYRVLRSYVIAEKLMARVRRTELL